MTTLSQAIRVSNTGDFRFNSTRFSGDYFLAMRNGTPLYIQHYYTAYQNFPELICYNYGCEFLDTFTPGGEYSYYGNTSDPTTSIWVYGDGIDATGLGTYPLPVISVIAPWPHHQIVQNTSYSWIPYDGDFRSSFGAWDGDYRPHNTDNEFASGEQWVIANPDGSVAAKDSARNGWYGRSDGELGLTVFAPLTSTPGLGYCLYFHLSGDHYYYLVFDVLAAGVAPTYSITVSLACADPVVVPPALPGDTCTPWLPGGDCSTAWGGGAGCPGTEWN